MDEASNLKCIEKILKEYNEAALSCADSYFFDLYLTLLKKHKDQLIKLICNKEC